MAARLLPANATELERLAAEVLAQIERVPVPLRQLWNPDTCPVEDLFQAQHQPTFLSSAGALPENCATRAAICARVAPCGKRRTRKAF